MTDHPPQGISHLEWAMFSAIINNDSRRVRALIHDGIDPKAPYCGDIAQGAPYSSPLEQAQLRGNYDVLAVML